MRSKLFINGFSSLVGDAPAEAFAPFVDVRKLRRAETVSKNVLLCACQALAQAKITPQEQAALGISLAMGAGALSSTIKFMDSIIDDGDELSSPTAFASSVHNSTALMLSMFLQIHGPCVITGQFDASFAGALITAQQFLAKKMCRHVLVALTEDVNPVVTQILTKDPHIFDPYVYQPEVAPARVAVALVVSDEPTPTTRFVLPRVELIRTDDMQATLSPTSVSSCAHDALALVRQFDTQKPFVLDEKFAGSVLHVEGEPYVPA